MLEDIKNKIESFNSKFEVLLENLNSSKTLGELKKDLDSAILNKASKDTLNNNINNANCDVETKHEELEKQKQNLQKDLPDSLKSIALEEVLQEIEKTISYNKTKADFDDINIDESLLNDSKKTKSIDFDYLIPENLLLVSNYFRYELISNYGKNFV